MFNCLPGTMLASGIRTNVERALAAAALCRTIALCNQQSQGIQSGATRRQTLWSDNGAGARAAARTGVEEGNAIFEI
jgi:hypothetical protein